MPNPSIDSVEFSDGAVYLSTEGETPVPVEIVIYGQNLANISQVVLDSGQDYQWLIGNVSAGSNSIVVTAYAYGQTSGPGSVAITIDAYGPRMEETEFVLPLI